MLSRRTLRKLVHELKHRQPSSLVAACVSAIAAASASKAQVVYYVDADALNPGAGTSWCTAFDNLDDALAASGAGDTILVAGGIYKPDPTGLADPREATFTLAPGVVIEGGYAGCGAADPDERVVAAFQTTLSGDLNGDDAVGGAIFNDMALVELINCTLAGNAARTAAGIRNYAAVTLTMTNCILWGNQADEGSGEDAQIINTASVTEVNHSCIQGWTGALGGAHNTGANPMLVDPDGTDNVPGTADDNLRLQTDSPSIDAGDNAVVSVAYDLDGHPRIVNGTVDMGAYEFQPPPGAGVPAATWWSAVVAACMLLVIATLAFRRKGSGTSFVQRRICEPT